ncbi:MAG TPA: aminotransferase class I/II-fold pyridoxal phosphate-dependent enzyme [Clostridiales bacterium]|nr:aminotransferase class I/II-fold pyridoxal phosphate-dependent enzyme [Clostridiales bacterium]
MLYKEFNKEQKLAFFNEAQKKYDEFKAQGLSVNMARGKPCKEQLDLSDGIFDAISSSEDCFDSTGLDLRNYGELLGTYDCRKLFGELLGVPAENVIACGSASLTLMYDYISQCITHGAGSTPWGKLDKVKFIAVVPGYDRHFAIAEYFGIELVNVEMLEDGPDMNAVNEHIKDESVKGMFIVPKYSNPTGYTISEEIIEKLAQMKPAASDFRVIWDNAYICHDFDINDGDPIYNIFDYAKKYGTEDLFIEFTSTSKITFAGAGVSAIAASDANIKAISKRLNFQVISYDKINQIRHVKYLKNVDGIMAQMQKHGEIMKPKFDAVLEILEKELGGLGIAKWTNPKGGYFISLDVLEGSAKRVGQLAKEAGLTMTTVGATFPYGIDPNDSNIRIAPSFPLIDELKICAELLCTCIKLAAGEANV